MLCGLLLFGCLYYIGLDVRKPVLGGLRTTNSVGRCVILCAFLVKVSNIHFLQTYILFSCRKCICLRKKMFTITPWRFNVTVTSQVAYSFLAYLRLENGVL